MKIAILGFGTIGSGVYEVITKGSKKTKELSVLKVLDLPTNKDKLPIITCDINDITSNEDIDLVVETMGGIHPAYEYICACLKAKKHVVTANKAVVAKHLKDFIDLANENNVNFMFEASVGGGIPWLASITKASRIDDINRFYAIFNGTSNFILDHMSSSEKDFDEALGLAQELGYAEANPSADIDGYDVQNKVVISSNLAFASSVDMDDFTVFSMRNICIDDIHYLKEKGYGVKYIGEAQRINHEYEVFVMPNIFMTDSIEANIKTNFNIATLQGETIGDLKFYGQGAGKLATANAIIQDIFDIKMGCSNIIISEDCKLSHSDKLSSNQFIIRTSQKVELISGVESINIYKGNYYITTENMTAFDFKARFCDIIDNDDKIFVGKIANFN